MRYKTLLLALFAMASASAVYSQDQLFKKNGDMMEVKVTEISARTVSFKKASNLEGPTYTIPKGDVAKIIYENDSEDYFGEVEAQRKAANKKPVKYGHNIISAMPMQLMTEGVGVGLAYERVIDKAGILSFYLPVTTTIANFESYNTGMGGPRVGDTRGVYYFMPGLKFYPTGSKGVVRYAVGPNIVYRTGEEFTSTFFPMSPNGVQIQDVGWKRINTLGIIVSNSLNINPTPHLHLGLELGLGFTYWNSIGGSVTDPQGLVQFGFKMGYRF